MSGLSRGVILAFDIKECYHPVVSAALCKLALMCFVFLFSTTSLNLIYRVGTSWSLTNFCNHPFIENSVKQKKRKETIMQNFLPMRLHVYFILQSALSQSRWRRSEKLLVSTLSRRTRLPIKDLTAWQPVDLLGSV